ncbi:DUF6538 domain-containing protein [Pandoraea pnomenusa]|uniref:DUF6538 domain-containing protein n=1 Tax=Pandoraea pnomenusa TaxID=93220 RepID=UPI0037CCB738
MLPTGLVRDKDSGVYYLRRRIPADVLSCYPPGQKEYSRSLRTKDYRTAIDRHRREEAKLTAEWDKHRQRLTQIAARQQLHAVQRIDALTPEVIDAICTHLEVASLAPSPLAPPAPACCDT